MQTQEERLDSGWGSLESGEAQAALQTAREILGSSPDDAEALCLAASACLEMAEHEEAERMIRRALAVHPDSPPALVTLADILYETCRFEEAAATVRRALAGRPDDPYVWHLQGLILDMVGARAGADESFARAASLDPEGFPPPPAIDREQFGRAIQEALAGLPAGLQERIANLPILLEEVPSKALLETLDFPSPDLLGLFVGVPLPEKTHGDLPRSPDAVYLFKRNLERACEGPDDLIEEIRVTLLHEIGHFLGMDEADLDEAGYA